MALQWPDEHKDRFMVHMPHAAEHDVSGYALASVSDITDIVADNAFQESVGEDGREFRVWRLSPDGPVPAKVTCQRHAPIGMVEVIISWRVAVGGGKYETAHESGYYRMTEV